MSKVPEDAENVCPDSGVACIQECNLICFRLLARVHVGPTEVGYRVWCSRCGEEFTVPGELGRHLRDAHGVNPPDDWMAEAPA